MSFNVETTGSACPAGHVLRYSNEPGGTAVMLNEYACAADGSPQALDGIANVRVPLAPSAGPPDIPAGFRVSAMRHGVAG